MSWWRDLFAPSDPVNIKPNANGPVTFNPGDPDGFQYDSEPFEARALPVPVPSAWDGWPSDWDTPNWQQINLGINKLVDIAWACLDLNSNIVSAMPVYRMRDQRIIDPVSWMMNPDPTIYSSWQEFMKQAFWDFQMGECFIMRWATDAQTGKPSRMRVIPPWAVNVDMVDGLRTYRIGQMEVPPEDILHLRYQSDTSSARGRGPLEIAGARLTQIRLLERYASNLAETGGVPLYWIGLDRKVSKSEAQDLLDTWIETRSKYAAHPAVLGAGSQLNQARTMDAKEMGLLEITQFSESRIAVLLGVPAFLVGLAGASGSLTYSNIADLFDFHDRSSLRPKSKIIMEGLSDWGLVRGQSAELNRDDYTRLPLDKRMQAYKTAIEMDILTPKEVRIMERYYGEPAAQALTGGSD